MSKIVEDSRLDVVFIRIQPERAAKPCIYDHAHCSQHSRQKQDTGNLHKERTVPDLKEYPAHKQG